MESLQYVKSDAGASKHLNITHLNGPSVFETKSGQVGSIIEFKGIPFDAASVDDIEDYRRIKHSALLSLSDDFCIYEYVFRSRVDVNLSGEFADSFSSSLNDAYQRRYEHSRLFENRLYCVVMLKGVNAGKVGGSLNFLQTLSNRSNSVAREAFRAESIERLNKAVINLTSLLSAFSPRVLGEAESATGLSGVMSFFGQIVNGGEESYQLPICPQWEVSGVDSAKKAIQSWPEGNISTFLPRKRLFFGNLIEFSEPGGASRYAAILSLKKYPSETIATIMSKLFLLDCEFVLTNSFMFEPTDLAQQKINRQRIKMLNANSYAASLIDELEACQDDLASERTRAGLHHNSLMLLGDDKETVRKGISQALKFYNDAGFSAMQETLGQEAAFWAQIPGNQKYIVRSSLITSENFIDFCPFYSYRTGYRDKNHLGGAVTLLESKSKTPVFFNFHAAGSGKRNDLTPGHTTIIGGNGSGKTVFMGFMDSQMSRYGGRSFFFDRDHGLEIYIRACGGRYFSIKPSKKQGVRFNPFWLEDSHENRSFVKKWICYLVQNESEQAVPAHIERTLGEAVDYAFNSLDRSCRNLSAVCDYLPIDFERWDQLSRWTRHSGDDGEYAYLFDNDEDNLDLNVPKYGFDFTDIISQPIPVFTSVCMYLVHRIKQSLDGNRVSIYFDEGWQILDNPYWSSQLKKDLPTLRKLNAHIVLATQSPESIVQSNLSAQFLDNCATNIFFCNNKADFERHYKHFNISKSEFDFIKETPKEERLFLYKQDDESSVCRLNLSGLDDYLAVFSANKTTVSLLDDLRREVGDEPDSWLPLFHQKRKEGQQ